MCSSSPWLSHSTPWLFWQSHFWTSSTANLHSSLVKGFYSWRDARGVTSYHQPHSQYALLFFTMFYTFWSEQDCPLLSAPSALPGVLNDLSDVVYSLGYSSTAEHILLQWSFPAVQWEFSAFLPARFSSLLCVPPQVIPFLLKHLHPSDVCRQLSHHFSFPHPHPDLLAKLYIFSSFNLSS